jgi:hypothetical protein
VSENWTALVFSDGTVEFTVTREELEEVMAAWQANDGPTIVAALDKYVAEVTSTMRDVKESRWIDVEGTKTAIVQLRDGETGEPLLTEED